MSCGPTHQKPRHASAAPRLRTAAKSDRTTIPNSFQENLEALAEKLRALELDPLSLHMNLKHRVYVVADAPDLARR